MRSPEGWSGWGTAVTPLGLGVACAWTQPPLTAQRPRPVKISVRHMPAHLRYHYTQHTQAPFPSFPSFPSFPFHSDTPQATRSTARRVSQECLTRVVCSRFSFRWLLLLPSVALLPRAPSCARRSYRPLLVTEEGSSGSGAFLLRELVEQELLDWERLGTGLFTLVPYLFIFLFFSSRFWSLCVQIHIQSTL